MDPAPVEGCAQWHGHGQLAPSNGFHPKQCARLALGPPAIRADFDESEKKEKHLAVTVALP